MDWIKFGYLEGNFIKQLVDNNKQGWKKEKLGWTDSGFPMIFATALVASLRMSEAITASTGTLVNRFKVGIALPLLLYTGGLNSLRIRCLFKHQFVLSNAYEELKMVSFCFVESGTILLWSISIKKFGSTFNVINVTLYYLLLLV